MKVEIENGRFDEPTGADARAVFDGDVRKYVMSSPVVTSFTWNAAGESTVVKQSVEVSYK